MKTKMKFDMKFIEKAKKLIGKNREVALISFFAAAAIIALLIIGASGYTVDDGSSNAGDDTQIEFSDDWDYSDDDMFLDDTEGSDSDVVWESDKDKNKDSDKKTEDKKTTTSTTKKSTTTTTKKTTTNKTSTSTNKKPSSSNSKKPTPSPTPSPSPSPSPSPEPTPDPEDKPDTDELTCTLTIKCDTAVGKCEEKKDIIPEDGVVFETKTVTFKKGENVFDVLQRELKAAEIHMEFEETPGIGSKYIKAINNLYEFDCGELSGWMYKVNDEFPNIGCSEYVLNNGDVIEWVYTCDLGKDVGAEEEPGEKEEKK